MAQLKYRDGSSWVEVAQSSVYIYDGSSWVTPSDVKAYDGSQYVSVFGSGGQAPALIDSFEDGDLSEYGGDTGSVTVTQDASTAVDGDYYLDSTDTSIAQIGSTSGLDAYPSPGDTFAANVYYNESPPETGGSGHRTRVGWGSVNGSFGEQYCATIDLDSNLFRLEIAGNATSNSTLASQSIDLSGYGQQWLEIAVSWETDGSMTLTLWASPSRNTKIAEVSATDSTYGAGGIGMQMQDNDVFIDNYRIT